MQRYALMKRKSNKKSRSSDGKMQDKNKKMQKLK